MKISHVNIKEQTNFIEVRQYPNSIVNVAETEKPSNSEFCSGVWKVKQILKIPSEYKNDYVFIKL
ncbi:hypothetical protein UFOVP530_12 [uncultured Caudovirales phage]|uniref:Uncharacterized protein n=1 Tax=uncultured Caudovirales phage TaxID=2100421 RepID=A0A6J5MNX4_9CAUD|nr:hypothetical protein UFOVP530_12 [uncultured Caudovirales phage]CAB4178847.1 hypothetical protein UFOVP1027_12 [uncultured Caudovirales phage]CAB4188414.1 hypothetical protein UFOVP1182_30 [uncultured Caudovirales phage]CAB4220637.1 hypothetical protein UFOVP1632_46 [uncultured Caudovirales phage]